MSTKHIRTTGDLCRFQAAMKIDCTDCGAAQTLGGLEVFRLAGSCDLHELAQRLRCSRCRGRSARLTILPPV